MKNLDFKRIENQHPHVINHVTDISLKKATNKNYFNGEKLKVGDIIYWVALKINENKYDVVRINNCHFDLFYLDEKDKLNKSCIPFVVLKN